MKFIDLVNRRQSVRRYLPEMVEKEKIERCLEAARLAPSASNSQPWSFIVVDKPDLRNKVATNTYDVLLSFNKFVKQAPVLVVFVLEKSKPITRMAASVKNLEFPLIDIGIAAEHFCLQAVEEGLGSCMIGWFSPKPIKKLLNIPSSKSIGLIVTLGYPPETYREREKTRKSFKEVVFYNGYKNSR